MEEEVRRILTNTIRLSEGIITALAAKEEMLCVGICGHVLVSFVFLLAFACPYPCLQKLTWCES